MSEPDAAADPLDVPTPPAPTPAGGPLDNTPLPVPGSHQPDYTGNPMIHLEGIHKAFGSRQILRGIDLAIYPGETVCLIGGSGTGKSVSLKHIMRLIDPDRGKIWLDGEDITEAHGDRLQTARTKLGVNFQFGALLNWMTIFENVALPLRENTRMKEKEIEERVMAKLELLSIPHARDLFPTQISGGMVKRAGLARAVVMEESLKVILYDEPTSGLDPISTAVVDEMVNDMKARLGLTQVIVTHDMTSAYRTADRIAVLHQGKLAQFGTPHEIQHSTVPYVQQFVLGLSTTEALEVNKKSGRLRKSGMIKALRESSVNLPKVPAEEVPKDAPAGGPTLTKEDLLEPPSSDEPRDDYSDLGDVSGFDDVSDEGVGIVIVAESTRFPSQSERIESGDELTPEGEDDSVFRSRASERRSRRLSTRRVAREAQVDPGKSEDWMTESQALDDLGLGDAPGAGSAEAGAGEAPASGDAAHTKREESGDSSAGEQG